MLCSKFNSTIVFGDRLASPDREREKKMGGREKERGTDKMDKREIYDALESLSAYVTSTWLKGRDRTVIHV